MIAVLGHRGLPTILAVGPRNFGNTRSGMSPRSIARAEAAE